MFKKNRLINKKGKIEYITLEEMKEEIKSGIIVLENRYFKIEKIILEEDLKDVDEEDRDLEIEAILEDRIKNYDPTEYIEKEIDLEGEILIILIKRKDIEIILEEAKRKKIEVFGIIPSFLLRELELKNIDRSTERFIDVDKKDSFIVDFENGKIKDILTVEIEKERILEGEKEDILQYVFDIDLENLNFLSFYEKDREIGEIFENIENIKIEICNWKEKEIIYDYKYDFLPLEYIDNLKKNRFIKKGIILSFIIFIFQISLGFGFQYLLDIEKGKAESLENEIVENQDKIGNIKEKILEMEEQKKLREEEIKKIEFKNLKLSEILKKIDKFKPNGVDILNIEFSKSNEKNKIKIIGNSINEEKILNFQEEIVNSHEFKNINHDYIKKDEEIYIFQIEAEV